MLLSGFVLLGAQRALAGERRTAGREPTDGYLIAKITRHQKQTWHWQRVIGRPLTPTRHSARREPSHAYRRWVLRLWKRRSTEVYRQALRVPNRWAWTCIHRHEGAWTDPSPPYYGGLQMDLAFQRTYGAYLLRRKGTADRWTPLEQMWVAERARRSGRGFFPWPNTARMCGLL